MGKWTQEPWRNMDGFGIIYGNYDAAIHREPMVCRSPDQFSINDNNFNRIVACVNAMQGITNPAAFVAAARALRNAVRCEDRDKFGVRCHGVNPAKDVYEQCETCHHAGQFDKASPRNRPKEVRNEVATD